ncbi:hypothetical protein ACLHZU_07500 [Aeromonas salmonicida]|uniref:hypothetical protein n=1 Tax=Aeromonas salmonicida TaxID=645 RepID=UPI003D05D91B
MSVTHFVPAQPGEFGYLVVDPNDNGETILERSPLIGYSIRITENSSQEQIVQTLPVCTIGESFTPAFIQRYDGTFTDCDGEHIRYTLEGMMELFGFEADDQIALPPTNAKELSEYVWRPLRNPQD